MMWVILSWVMVASLCYFILKHVDNPTDPNAITENQHLLTSSPLNSAHNKSSAEWMNQVINWIYQNVVGAPEPLKEWIRSLNDAAKKVSTNKCGVIFEGFGNHISDKVSPKLENIRVEQGPRDHLTVRSDIHLPVVRLNLVSSQRTTDQLIVSNMKATITDLRGEIECRLAMIANQVFVMGCFSGRPEMDIEIQNCDAQSQSVPAPLVEECIRRCVLSAVTNINISQMTNAIISETDAKPFENSIDMFKPMKENGWVSNEAAVRRSNSNTLQSKPPEMFEKISLVNNTSLKPVTTPPNKLNIKIDKANGLSKDGKVKNVLVVVEMDEPPQKFSTTIPTDPKILPPNNQHTFTLSPASEEILFEVYEDGHRDEDEKKFMGLCIVNFDEIHRSKQNVHDLKLQSRPYSNDKVSGGLTASFDFFHDPNETSTGVLRDVVKIRDNKGSEFRETCTTKRQTLEGANILPENIEITPTTTTQITVKTVSQQLKEKPVIHSISGSMENAVDPETQIMLTKRFNPDNTETIKQLTTELKKVQESQKAVNPGNERVGRSTERSKKEGSRDRSFFGEMRDRLSGRFKRNPKRSKSVDINHADIEEAVSLPPSRDPSRTRYIVSDYNRDTKYMETRSVGGRSRSSNKSLYQHSSLVLELEQDGRQNYLLIPPAVLSEPAAANLMKRGKKLHIYNDHTFVAVKMKGGVGCNVCEHRIKPSFSKQAYQCRDCKLVCHKSCHYKIDGFCSQSTLSKLQIARDIDWAHFLSHYPLEEFISLDGF